MLKHAFRGLTLCAAFTPLAACSSGPASGELDELETTDDTPTVGCMVENPTSSEPVDAIVASKSEALLDPGSCASAPVIQVWVHHLQGRFNGVLEKNISQNQLAAIPVQLSNVYRSTTVPNSNYRFVLAGMTTTENNTWYQMVVNPSSSAASASERDAKAALRRGDRTTLNIYVGKPVDQFGRGLFGSSTLPSRVASDLVRDGVVIHQNLLDTAIVIHEVGHWLGLLHPYETGCIEPGDGVADTPLQFGPLVDCSPSDSCRFEPGVDPVTNYMNNTGNHTTCLTKLTPGQRVRLNAQYRQFRCGT